MQARKKQSRKAAKNMHMSRCNQYAMLMMSTIFRNGAFPGG
jgi:hypothetical protein